MSRRLEAALAGGRFLLLGMVHLPPLPGSPGWAGSMAAVLEAARRDAAALAEAGLDGVVVENHGDVPYHPGAVPPETVAAMAVAVAAVRAEVGPEPLVGVNVLRNDARAGLAVAAAAGADLVRINVHAGAMWTDQGLLQGRAWETLRERARLAPDVALVADVLVKHGVPPVPTDPAQAAREAAERGLADAVVVTGPATGAPADPEVVRCVRRAVRVPVLVGSGVTADTLARYTDAHGAIVGSWLEEGGRAGGRVNPERARRLVAARSRLSRVVPGGASR